MKLFSNQTGFLQSALIDFECRIMTVMMFAERVADWSKSYVDQPSRQMLGNHVL